MNLFEKYQGVPFFDTRCGLDWGITVPDESGRYQRKIFNDVGNYTTKIILKYKLECEPPLNIYGSTIIHMAGNATQTYPRLISDVFRWDMAI